MTQSTDNETPTLEQVIQRAIERRVSEMHTAIPAKIVSFDGTKATVQPLLRRKLVGGTLLTLPVVTNVPVQWPRAGDAYMTFPLEADHTGSLLVMERSIDRWLVAGGTVSPEDPRKFNISDGVFIPGLYPHDDAPEHDSDRLQLRFGDSKFTINKAGKFQITDGTEELLDLLKQAVELLSTTTTNTMLGPMKLNDFAQFATIASKIDGLKE